MLSTTNRINQRENQILLTAVAKHRAALIKATAGTNYLQHTNELKYIDRLIQKFTDNQHQFNICESKTPT